MTHHQRSRKDESNRIKPRDESLESVPDVALDALLNAALDAEACGDLSAAQEAWAQIAAMDEQRRRGASLLSSGLTQLRGPGSQATTEVSDRVVAGVMARLNFTMPEAATAAEAPARDEAGAAQAMDHFAALLAPPVGMPHALVVPELSGISSDMSPGISLASSMRDVLVHEASAQASISTGRPWGLPSARHAASAPGHGGGHGGRHSGGHGGGRRRRWYQLSPLLASFVLGSLVTLGLMMIKHYGERSPSGLASSVAAPPAATSVVATQVKPQLLPQWAAPAGPSSALAGPLEMGDTSRYSQWQGIGLGAAVDGPPGWLRERRAEHARSVFDRSVLLSEFKATWKPSWDADHRSATKPVHSGDTLWFYMLEEDDLLVPARRTDPAKLPPAR